MTLNSVSNLDAAEYFHVKFSKIFQKDFIYLFEKGKERESEHKWGEVHKAEGEADSPRLSREPDAGLDPRTPRS